MSVDTAQEFPVHAKIETTGSFSFEGMSALFVWDPDRKAIELDSYDRAETDVHDGYSSHPR